VPRAHRILIVEDDARTGASIDMYLRHGGFRTELARSGPEGLAKARPGRGAPERPAVSRPRGRAHLRARRHGALRLRGRRRARGAPRHRLHAARRRPRSRPNTASLPGRPSSAGGAFATAGDLLRFYSALGAGKLLSRGSTRSLFGGAFDDPPGPQAFGVAGGAPGVNAAVQREDGWTVIALSNLDPPSAIAAARRAMDIVRGRPRPPPAARGRPRPAGAEVRIGPESHRPPPAAPAATELTPDVAVPATRLGRGSTSSTSSPSRTSARASCRTTPSASMSRTAG